MDLYHSGWLWLLVRGEPVRRWCACYGDGRMVALRDSDGSGSPSSSVSPSASAEAGVDLSQCSVEATPERWPANSAPLPNGSGSPTQELRSVCWFEVVAARGGAHTTFGAASRTEALQWIGAILRIAQGNAPTIDYLYQHERRWGPGAAFSGCYLFPGESEWADSRGVEMDAATHGLPPALGEAAALQSSEAAVQALEQAGWERIIAADTSSDADGWAYAASWHGAWRPQPLDSATEAASLKSQVSMVRRRAWVRYNKPADPATPEQQTQANSEQLQLMAQLERAAEQLSSGFGCEVGVIVFDDRGRLAQRLAPASVGNDLGPVLQRFRSAANHSHTPSPVFHAPARSSLTCRRVTVSLLRPISLPGLALFVVAGLGLACLQ